MSEQRKPQRAPRKTQPADATESDSATATAKQPMAPRKKKTSSSSKKKKGEKEGNAPKDSIKVVVRLLPANLHEGSFWDTVKELVSPETCHAKYFVQGHYSTKPFRTPVYSRAYIQFKKVPLADAFVEKFKAMPFEDDKESTIPQFTSCLYNRMPEDREEESSSKHLLQETKAFKLFLKYQAGEIEKPKTFLSSAKAAEEESKEAEKQIEEKKVEDKLVKEAGDDKAKKQKKKKRSKTENKDAKKDNSPKDAKIDGKAGQKKDKKPREKSKSTKDTKDKPLKDTKDQQNKEKPEEKATTDKLTGEKAKSKSKSRRKREKEKVKEKEKDTKSPSSNASQSSNPHAKSKILMRKQDVDLKDQTSPKVIMKRRPVS